MRGVIFLSMLSIAVLSCKEAEGHKDNGLEEVRIDGKTSNADIVRMPISANKPLDSVNVAKINFEETFFAFGEVQAGTIIKHTFNFKNEGNQPLLISDVRTTCGCTVPEWNKNPIAPGESDKIDVSFDTNGKEGMQVKKITIIANTFPAETEIEIRGFVNTK